MSPDNPPGWRHHTLLVVACGVIVLPCVFLVLGSLKTVEQLFADPFGLPTNPAWSNYSEAWTEGSMGRALLNSVVIATASVVISTFTAAMAAFAIAYGPSRLRLAWFLLFVGGLMVPVQLILLAIFSLLRSLDLLGSPMALIVVYSVFGIPLGVLVLTVFIRSLPRELWEAAEVDGASTWLIFRRITMPLSRGALLATSILNGIWIWNDVFVALVLATNRSTTTLPLSILNFFGTYSSEWGLIFAGVVMSAAPVVIVYALFSRRFVSGLTAGALKG